MGPSQKIMCVLKMHFKIYVGTGNLCPRHSMYNCLAISSLSEHHILVAKRE